MQVHYDRIEYYDANYEVTFVSDRMNNVHWYVWDTDYNSITLAHDDYSDVIEYCKTLGDSIEVYIDGDRHECMLEVTKSKGFGDELAVYVTLELTPDDDALHDGPYDVETRTETTP